MIQTPHQIRQRIRGASVPLSVFALLAFACFPAFSLAEDSSGIQYQDAPPTVTGKKTSQPPASTSGAGGGTGSSGKSATGPGSTADGSSGDDSSSEDTGGAVAGKDGGSGKGSQDRAAGKGDGKIGEGNAVSTPAPGEASSDGGSSPLVPILIALAALAAISIGVVAIKRRRQDPGAGSSVSPEAS